MIFFIVPLWLGLAIWSANSFYHGSRPRTPEQIALYEKNKRMMRPLGIAFYVLLFGGAAIYQWLH